MSLQAVGLGDFIKEVYKSDKPVLVDFWGPQCGPCRTVKPVLESVAAKSPNAKVVTVNVDEEPELAGYFKITGVPTVVLFNKGKAGERLVGARRETDFINLLDTAA